MLLKWKGATKLLPKKERNKRLQESLQKKTHFQLKRKPRSKLKEMPTIKSLREMLVTKTATLRPPLNATTQPLLLTKMKSLTTTTWLLSTLKWRIMTFALKLVKPQSPNQRELTSMLLSYAKLWAVKLMLLGIKTNLKNLLTASRMPSLSSTILRLDHKWSTLKDVWRSLWLKLI